MREYKRLFQFIRPHLGLFVWASLFMGLSAIFDGVSIGMILPVADKVLNNKPVVLPTKMPPYVSGFIDVINSIPPMPLLRYVAVAVLILVVLKGLIGFLQSYLMDDIAQRVARDLRSKTYAKFQVLSLDFFTHRRGGELMSRITNDVNAVGNAISCGATDIIYQAFQVVVFTVFIFFVHAKLALISIILLPLISFPIIKVGKALKKIARQTQEKMADLNSILYETILGVRIVKAFNMEEAELKKFDAVNNSFYKLFMKSIKRTLLLSPVTEFIGILAGLFVLLWGFKEVTNARMSSGVLIVFLAALLSLIRPFKRLSLVNAIIQRAVAGSIRIHEIWDMHPTVKEKPDAQTLSSFREKIVFEDVRFTYGLHEVLCGINLEVKKGEVIAIVGPSGAGKTTLMDLLPRFYDPSKGRILIDGKDTKDFTLKSLRQNIGIVTQETILFNDSVSANIAFGMQNARQHDIEEAAKQAYIHEVIKRMKNGYDAFIGDRGVKLSGGERQRIAIARVLLKNAPILVLDEATSQLDTESERLIQETLNLLIKGRTVFVIAHRLSTIKNVDRIIVLESGKVVEIGSHEELLNQDGLYKKLYLNQL
jgi:subfamily B ATP-binding cassette protein MsbA